MARWTQNIPLKGEQCVGYTIIAGWLPWNYRCVMTLWSDGDSPLERLVEDIRKIAGKDDEIDYPGSTVVYKCDSDGICKKPFNGIPARRYATRQEAQEGHETFVRNISSKWFI